MLVGVPLELQAVAIVAGGPFLGLASTSNVVEAVIGL